MVLEYCKTHFPGLFCLRKEKLEKWPFLDEKHQLTFQKNVNFLNFLTFRFYSLERCLLLLEYRKTHFFGLYCLKKKRWKMAIFGPKPWVKPFGIMSIFRLFELCVFIAQKGVLWFQNIVKDFFLAYVALEKKSWKNGHF